MVTESSVMAEKMCWNRADHNMVVQEVRDTTRDIWDNIFLRGPHLVMYNFILLDSTSQSFQNSPKRPPSRNQVFKA